MSDITAELVTFREVRRWGDDHTPANLARAIAAEAGELNHLYLWNDRADWDKVCDELGDVLIYAFYLAERLGVTPESLIRRKVAKNAEKYPCEV